jgi:hypothetical protein
MPLGHALYIVILKYIFQTYIIPWSDHLLLVGRDR